MSTLHIPHTCSVRKLEPWQSLLEPAPFASQDLQSVAWNWSGFCAGGGAVSAGAGGWSVCGCPVADEEGALLGIPWPSPGMIGPCAPGSVPPTCGVGALGTPPGSAPLPTGPETILNSTALPVQLPLLQLLQPSCLAAHAPSPGEITGFIAPSDYQTHRASAGCSALQQGDPFGRALPMRKPAGCHGIARISGRRVMVCSFTDLAQRCLGSPPGENLGRKNGIH